MFKYKFMYILFSLMVIPLCYTMEDPREQETDDNSSWVHTDIKTDFTSIKDIKFNATGKQFAIVGKDSHFVQVGNIKTRNLILKCKHPQIINFIEFHPKLDILAIGSNDSLRLWNNSTGEFEGGLHNNHSALQNNSRKEMTSLGFFYDEHTLIFLGCSNGSASIRRSGRKELSAKIANNVKKKFTTWLIIASINSQTDTGPIDLIAFNNSGSLVVSATLNGVVSVYRAPFEVTRNNQDWPLQYSINLGQTVKLIKFRAGHSQIFISTKSNNYVINLVESKIYETNISDYNPVQDSYLKIEQNHVSEFKTDSQSGNVLFEENCLIKSVIYNNAGNLIVTILENDNTNVWLKKNNQWTCIGKFNNDVKLTLSPNKNCFITYVNSNIVSIWEPSLLNQIEISSDIGNKRSRDENKPFGESQKRSKTHAIVLDPYIETGPEKSSKSTFIIDQNQEEVWKFVEDEDRAEDISSGSASDDNQQNFAQNERMSRKQKEIQNFLALHKLINRDPDIFKKSLVEIVFSHPEDLVKSYIAQYKGNINEQDSLGRTALYVATDSDKFKIVKLLLKQNAEVNLSDNKGFTPLHISVKHNFEKNAKQLIRYNADLNIRDHDGNTSLHLAVKSRNISLIKLLLDAKANMQIENNNSESALGLVFLSQDIELINIFADYIELS